MFFNLIFQIFKAVSITPSRILANYEISPTGKAYVVPYTSESELVAYFCGLFLTLK